MIWCDIHLKWTSQCGCSKRRRTWSGTDVAGLVFFTAAVCLAPFWPMMP